MERVPEHSVLCDECSAKTRIRVSMERIHPTTERSKPYELRDGLGERYSLVDLYRCPKCSRLYTTRAGYFNFSEDLRLRSRRTAPICREHPGVVMFVMNLP